VLAAARHGDAAEVSLADVTPATAGIKGRGGAFVPVIRRNQRIPCRELRSFRTAEGTGDDVTFELFQGECELATENTYVGRFVVDGLRGRGEFRIAFAVDADGLLEVAEVDAHNVSRPVPLQLSGGLGAEEIEELQKNRAERTARPVEPSTPMPTPTPKTATLKIQRPTGIRAAGEVDESPSLRARVRRPTSQRVDSTGPPASSIDPSRPMEVGADSLVGTILGERYRVTGIVAEGGMGRVYAAEHTLLRKRFAIKVLHPELARNRELAERFVSEAQAASAIQSDHVVSIFDFGLLPDGTGYFVMEYLEGETLEQALRARGPLGATVIRSIGMQVADGLRGAHEQNIVHRDLKPANIMLVEKGGRPNYCKILDFGIAKRPTSDSHSPLTMVGVMVGTPHYMAPEQIDGVPVDGRCDLYSLGIVLYEMATGVPPYDSESVAQLLGMQKWGEPAPVHEVYPDADCPPPLEAVILRCMQKSPEDRYQSAEELAEALART
jgi:serine/threonine-protein kinase